MDKKIIEKFNMFTNVDDVLTDNSIIVATIPAFQTLAGQFHTEVEAIATKMQPLLLDYTGDAKGKKKAKKELSVLLASICGAVKDHALAIDDQSLYAKANLSPSELKGMRDTELQEKSIGLYNLALGMAASLLPYNVTAASLTALNTAVLRFKEYNPKVRNQQVENKTNRALLYKDVWTLNTFVRLRMDNAASMFKVTHPEFYALYKNARRNYSEGVRHRQPEPPVELAAKTVVQPIESYDNGVQKAMVDLMATTGNNVQVAG
ncbi:MAG: hypothetical protein IPM82_24640 [Saprospiraceae bacterium]|nr:hypothetical protein [Saprospiraceae bacterium]